MIKNNSENLRILEGNKDRVTLVICDSPSHRVYSSGSVMTGKHMDLFGKCAKECGMDQEDFVFISCSPPIPDICEGSEKRVGEFLNQHREEFLEEVNAYLPDANCIITMGKNSIRQLKGRSVKITTSRGRFQIDKQFGDVPIMPMISPANVMRKPDMFRTFKTDFDQVGALADNDWDLKKYQETTIDYNYEWCLDIQDLLDNPPKSIVVDTETDRLSWYDGLKVLIIQISYKEGHSLLLPMSMDYWNDESLIGDTSRDLPRHTKKTEKKLWGQVRELLGNPKVQVAGHNFKFDIHALKNHDVEVANWLHDTMQLTYVVDDNMQIRSLDECVRLRVPAMSGYADSFNDKVDKSNMRGVSHDLMLPYAGGDTDSCLRLIKAILPEAKKDKMNYLNYTRVQMPSLRMFIDMERNGIEIDTDELYNLQVYMQEEVNTLLESILQKASEVAPKVMIAHKDKGWSMTRADFVTDLLFTKDGFGLKPKVFTPSTRKLPKEDRKPSSSANEHLPFFDDVPIVQDIMQYSKMNKLMTTYIGKKPEKMYTEVRALKSGKSWMAKWAPIMEKLGVEPFKQDNEKMDTESISRLRGYKVYPLDDGTSMYVSSSRVFHCSTTKATGFWQHLDSNNKIHTTMSMSKTDTGRSASQDPNTQNLPKRGAIAKQFRKIFKAPEGWMFTSSDLSQAELRIAGWASGDKEMLRIYSEGGDIHSSTAGGTIGKTYEEFKAGLADETPLIEVANDWKGAGQFLRALSGDAKKTVTVAKFCDYKRFQAKAINFGFLYGMWWTKFKDYAKTDFGLDLTDDDAKNARKDFFSTYPSLEKYHESTKKFARREGYVRALHGALRRLPSVHSDDEKVQQMAERQAVNSPIQKFASDLALIGMFRFFRDCPKGLAYPALFIHDDCTILHRIEDAEMIGKNLKFYMETQPFEWFGLKSPVPMVSDVSQGTRLDNLNDIKGVVSEAPEWYRKDLDEKWFL